MGQDGSPKPQPPWPPGADGQLLHCGVPSARANQAVGLGGGAGGTLKPREEIPHGYCFS